MSEIKLIGSTCPRLTVRVDLRSRQTIGTERSHAELFARCPLRGSYDSVDACASCQHFAGIRFVRRSRFGAVHCVLSEDAVRAFVAEGARDQASESGVVADVMARDFVCVRSDLSISTLGSLFIERRIGGAPVVNEEGRPIGVVSQTDLVRWVYAGRPPVSVPTVADVMTPVAFCLRANESIARAAALMAFEKIHDVPVISPLGDVVGMVSASDVLGWLARKGGFVLGDDE